MSGFKKFLLRGNVVDLAVAVVIGAAFGAIVTSFVSAFVTPLVGVATGAAGDFKTKSFTVGGNGTAADPGVIFPYGQFVDSAISFIIIAAVVYFFVVRPVQKMMDRFKTEPEASDPVKECPECLSKIPESASRCAFCTVEQLDVA